MSHPPEMRLLHDRWLEPICPTSLRYTRRPTSKQLAIASPFHPASCKHQEVRWSFCCDDMVNLLSLIYKNTLHLLPQVQGPRKYFKVLGIPDVCKQAHMTQHDMTQYNTNSHHYTQTQCNKSKHNRLNTHAQRLVLNIDPLGIRFVLHNSSMIRTSMKELRLHLISRDRSDEAECITE